MHRASDKTASGCGLLSMAYMNSSTRRRSSALSRISIQIFNLAAAPIQTCQGHSISPITIRLPRPPWHPRAGFAGHACALWPPATRRHPRWRPHTDAPLVTQRQGARLTPVDCSARAGAACHGLDSAAPVTRFLGARSPRRSRGEVTRSPTTTSPRTRRMTARDGIGRAGKDVSV